MLEIVGYGASTFLGRPLAATVRQLEATFDHVHVVPVSAASSSAPPPPAIDHHLLRLLVHVGLDRYEIRKYNRSSGSWDSHTRELLSSPPVAAYLDALALPVDTIADDVAAAVERAVAAEAARSGPRPRVVAAEAATAEALADANYKLRHCQCITIGRIEWTTVVRAFDAAQEQAVSRGEGLSTCASQSLTSTSHCGVMARARRCTASTASQLRASRLPL